MESKVSPTSMSGVNFCLAFGALANNKTTRSDVVRAYLQSWLVTKVPTWVEFSPEFVPDEFKRVKRPCVRLWRLLYGHPESGFRWDKRFREVMSIMGDQHIDACQSNYWLPKFGLLGSLYVDDIIVSGPEAQHEPFWVEPRKHLEVDEPSDVDRVLGREHHVTSSNGIAECSFVMTEFADNCCDLYEQLNGRKLKAAQSPYVAEGSLTDEVWQVRGALSQDASRVLMKVLWLARLARPDATKAISDFDQQTDLLAASRRQTSS